MQYQELYSSLQKQMLKNIEFRLNFWNELMDKNPHIEKLQTEGVNISNNLEVVTRTFHQINQLDPDNIKVNLIYGKFQEVILNNEQDGLGYIDKAVYLKKQSGYDQYLEDSDAQLYNLNCSNAIVTMSGNLNSLGIVLSAN